MDVLRSLTPARRTRTAALVTAVVVSVSGCAVGTSGEPTTAASAAPARVADRVGSVVPQAPTGVQLPDGRRVGIRAVGTTTNGVLDVPGDIETAGWWTGGSRLGDPFGSTLVAAHVDSTTQGLGPFASLLRVRPGDRLVVWSQGLKQTFSVRSLWLRPRGTLGARSWLHSPEGERRLVLVTCAGPFDPDAGGYQNLAVVVAEPRGKAVPRP